LIISKDNARKFFFILFGSLIYAAGMNLFVVPLGLYSGGILGIAQIIRTIIEIVFDLAFKFDISGIISFLLNVPLVIFAYFKIGKRFIKVTLFCIAIQSFLLSVIPIMPTLLTIVFVGICMYTGRNDIVFPSVVQKTIISIWAIGSFMFGLLPPFVRIKRNIFPCTEFRIGQNELIEENNSKKRNFIISTVVIGMVLGLIVNYVSDFLF